MFAHTPEAARAIESAHRRFSHWFMVDWDNDGSWDHPLSNLTNYVTRTSRDQALTSTAPSELLLIEGSAAAALDVEISGSFDGLSLVGHFAPYNGLSAFYASDEGIPTGVPVLYTISVLTDSGWQSYPQFTGVLKEVEVDRATNTVKLHCLDNVEKMRNAFSVAPYAADQDQLARGDKRGSLVDSSSLIDMAARSAGFVHGRSAKPSYSHPDINTLLSVPFHGSFLPEIGMLDRVWAVHRTEVWEKDPNRKHRAEAYVPGVDGLLALNAVPLGADAENVGAANPVDTAVKKYWIDPQVIPEGATRYIPWGVWGFHAFVRWDGPGTSPTKRILDLQVWDWHWGVTINGTTGAVNGEWQGPSGSVYRNNTIARNLQPGWNRVDVRFTADSFVVNGDPEGGINADVRVSVNGSTPTSARVYSGSLSTKFVELHNLVTIRNDYAISDVAIVWTSQVGWADYVGASNEAPRNSAALDPKWGRNRAIYTKRLTNTSAWDLAKEVAAAEYGVVYFDESGVFHFKNFETVQALQSAPPARKFSIDQLSGLSMRVTSDSVRNVWSVETRTARSRWGIVYDLHEDGPPLYAPTSSGEDVNPGELYAPTSRTNFTPGDFRVGELVGTDRYFFLPAPELLVCPEPWAVPLSSDANSEWANEFPQHSAKAYSGDTFRPGNTVSYTSWQRWYGRDFIHMNLRMSPGYGTLGFWNNGKNAGRFRLGGTMIYEDEARPVTFTTQDLVALGDVTPDSLLGRSLDRYGRRVIELKGNFWLQDSFQTLNMLRSVMGKFGRPIPVTDRIEAPGDPRIQLGDVIEVEDPDGFGGSVLLQIYGITRELEDGVGLRDTYQVEVVQPPGTGKWDDEQYGLWDQSFIWS